MIKLKNLLNEGTNDKVYVRDTQYGGPQLWIAYNPGSGTTHPLKDFKSAWITDKKTKFGHYNGHTVKDLVKWSNSNKAVLKNKMSRIHKIPVYNSGKEVEADIWGKTGKWGEEMVKPSGAIYMLIAKETDGSHVINFFKTFNEAKNWLKQQSNG